MEINKPGCLWVTLRDRKMICPEALLCKHRDIVLTKGARGNSESQSAGLVGVRVLRL
jgi:hypothetical protein